jgi:phosphoribosylaminoimidazole-succinocarboxamide synthase
VDKWLAERQLQYVLKGTKLPEWSGPKHVGKVRDSFSWDSKRAIVATDRISVFDFGVGYVPFKGQVLTELSAFWFAQTADIVPNHVLSVPDPNVTVAQECNAVPVEMIVRGYITGVTTTAMWYQYAAGARVFCGHSLPEGLKKNQRLPEPLVTPSTKETRSGLHDRSVAPSVLMREAGVNLSLYEQLESLSLALFARGSQIAAAAGYILVDTKYEFGLDSDGKVMLIDEIHTPDSSRFWRAESYEDRLARGEEMDYYDKEHVRLWLADRGLDQFGQDKEREAIPAELYIDTSVKFATVYEATTGEELRATVGDASERVSDCLRELLGLG